MTSRLVCLVYRWMKVIHEMKHAKSDIDRLIDEADVCFSSSFIEVQSVEEVKDGDDYWPY